MTSPSPLMGAVCCLLFPNLYPFPYYYPLSHFIFQWGASGDWVFPLPSPPLLQVLHKERTFLLRV